MRGKILAAGLVAVLLSAGAAAAQGGQQGLPRVKAPVPEHVRPRLEETGFAVEPQRRFDRLAKAYRWWSHKHYPVVVTADAALHTSHLYFEWYQRYLEVAYLQDDLLDLTDSLLMKMMQYRDEAGSEGQRDAALLGVCYLVVGKRLLTGGEAGTAPEPWGGKMQRELRLIREAPAIAESPLFGYREDYSQYRPRGHYSRSEELSRYFRAMMWFGRMAFRLDGDNPERALTHTRAAMLLCRALREARVNGEAAGDVWKRIYRTTAFFAGKSDDLLPTDYWSLQDAGEYDPASDEDVRRFIEAAGELEKPRILGTWELSQETAGGPDWRRSTAGLRLFGRRYSPDGEVIQKLIFDSVGEYEGNRSGDLPFTCVNARGMLIRGFPRGLDVMAVLGFRRARELLRKTGDDQYERYEKRFEEVRNALAQSPVSPAFCVMPDSLPLLRLRMLWWLRSQPDGRKPRAMTTESWPLKQLTAALGSWTELKHDTILYTKQPYTSEQMALAGATKGGPRPPEPPPPRGYVEPNPSLYGAIAVSVRTLLQRLKELNYPEDRALTGRLEYFAGNLDRLREISRKELDGETLSDADYKLIENIGYFFRIPRGGFPHHRDVERPFRTEMDDVMPIVADVHTDPNSGKVLEEAVGYPMTLYMECPVDGEPTVCLGAVYSHYEFKRPLAGRLTDEEWRRMLAMGKAPSLPGWMESYVVRE